ncbi:MAG: Rieske 2Fe-2S domain-containing protein, partial [Hyphomonadaceae bacterium]
MAETADYESLVVENNGHGAFRVARRAYHDEGVYRDEMERIFRRTWLYLGHESELAQPGSFLTRRIANRALLFIRGMDGQIRAFFNLCAHRGAELCAERRGQARSFTCMYHGWVFGADGKLLGRPGEARYPKEINADGSLNLPAVPRLEEYRGFFFVNFDRAAEPLESYLGNAREFIDLVLDQSKAGMRIVPGAHEYVIHANWKMMAENSVDIYHGQSLHPTYIEYLTSTTGAVNPLARGGGVSRDLGDGHSVVEYFGPWGRPVAQWIPMWGEAAKSRVEAAHQELKTRMSAERADRIALKSRNMLVFPNFVLNDIGAVTVRTFQPVSANSMIVHSWALAPKDEPEDMLA